jgi:hypothetical protein
MRPILGVFAIAGSTVLLTGCEPLENALAVMNNGQPMPGGPSSPVVSLHVSSVPQEVAQVAEVPAECVVPPARFREVWCNPDTGILEPIP